MTLDEEVTEFLQQGLAIHLGTRNERLEPNGARVAAVKIEDDRQHLVAYVPSIAAQSVLVDLQANGQVALAFARPVDDRACQVKGIFVSSWTASPAEERQVQRQWEGHLQQLQAVGIPLVATTSWVVCPCLAVRLRVTQLFDQTPGPKAGAQLQ